MKAAGVVFICAVIIFFIAFFSVTNTFDNKEQISSTFNADSLFLRSALLLEKGEVVQARELLFLIKGKAPNWKPQSIDSLSKKIDLLEFQYQERQVAEFAALMKNISKNHDDFQKITFYESKRNNWVSSQGARFQVEIYVGKYDEGRKYFRIRTEYKSESWMFYENVQLLSEFDRKLSLHCDYPEKQTEVFSGGVREWSDNPIDEGDLFRMMAGDKITARFDGKYRYDFKLSKNQVTSLKEMVMLYQSL